MLSWLLHTPTLEEHSPPRTDFDYVSHRGQTVGQPSSLEAVMVFDIVVAALITILAVILGITVHPVLLFIIVLAVVYLVVRHRSRV